MIDISLILRFALVPFDAFCLLQSSKVWAAELAFSAARCWPF